MSTNKSGNNSGDNGKGGGGAREWVKKTIASCITVIG